MNENLPSILPSLMHAEINDACDQLITKIVSLRTRLHACVDQRGANVPTEDAASPIDHGEGNRFLNMKQKLARTKQNPVSPDLRALEFSDNVLATLSAIRDESYKSYYFGDRKILAVLGVLIENMNKVVTLQELHQRTGYQMAGIKKALGKLRGREGVLWKTSWKLEGGETVGFAIAKRQERQ